jgi:hypothetical protein
MMVGKSFKSQRQVQLSGQPEMAIELAVPDGGAGLARLLAQRIGLADQADAIWHDAEDVFAELEAINAVWVS